MLNILGWLVVGALLGWLGSIGLQSNRSRLLNLVAASIGAVLGGMWFSWTNLGALISVGSVVSPSGLFIASLGAISVLTITSVAQHGHGLAPASAKVLRTPDGVAPPVDTHR